MRNIFKIILLLCCTSSLWGVSREPYTLGVSFSLRIHVMTGEEIYSGDGAMEIIDESTPPPDVSTYAAAGATASSGFETAWLKPWKKYAVNLEYNNLTTYDLSFIAPEGYEVYINDIRSDLYSNIGSTYSYESLYIQLRPSVFPGNDQAGGFSGIGIGKSIAWNFGLGHMAADRIAGRVCFREFDLTNSPGSRARLYYEPELTFGLATVPSGAPFRQKMVYNGMVLRQIMMPQAFVDFIDETDGYSIKFYTPNQATFGTTEFTVTGSPWKTIRVQVSGSPVNVLTITETEGSVNRVHQLTLTSGSVPNGDQVWELKEGDGTVWPRTTTVTSTVHTGYRNETVVVKNASDVVATKTVYRYEDKDWGEQITQITTNPDGGANALTRSFIYHEDDAYKGNYRRTKAITEADDQWVAFDYYDDDDRLGQLCHEYRPWNNSPGTYTLTPSSGRVTTYDYAADNTGRKRIISSEEVKVDNTTIGLTTTTPTYETIHGIINIKRQIDAAFATGTGNVNRTTSYIGDNDSWSTSYEYQDKTFAVIRPDKSQYVMKGFGYGAYNATNNTYDRLAWPWTHWRDVSWNGTSDSSGSGTTELTSFDSITIVPIYLVPGKSLMEIRVCELNGLPIRTEKYVYVSGDGTSTTSYALLGWSTFTYDPAGRMLTRTDSNGAVTTNEYTNGRLFRTTDPAGTVTEFSYDELGRVQDKTKKTASGGSDLVTRYAYDAADRITSETIGQGQSETLVTSTTFDLSGRSTGMTPPGLGATSIAYDKTYRTRTTTTPAGTSIETFQLDGRLTSLTGTSVVSKIYTYSLDSGRLLTRCDHGTSTRWEKTWTDWLGRTVEQRRPGWSTQPEFVGKYTYHGTTGLLTKYERFDSSSNRLYSDTYYEYDTHAQLTRSGLDVGAGGTLDPASSDQITDTSRYFENYSSAWWLREETKTYPYGSNSGTAFTVSLNRTRVTGHGTGVRDEVQTTDRFGNVITRLTTVNTSTKTVTVTTSRASLGNQVETIVNGLPKTVQTPDGLTYTTGYDTLERANTSVDPRIGTTTTAFVSSSHLPSTVTDAVGLLITYGYDTAGRKVWEKDPENQYSRYAYNARSQIEYQWGEATQPARYEYDSTYGDLLKLHTYRAGTDWDGSNWPTSTTGAPDTTTFAYDPATGLLNSKADAAGAAVTYTYNARGQTGVRTWARGVTTTYEYHGETGELDAVNYSDSTPDIDYNLDRQNLPYQITDATGLRTFDRCACGRVNHETLDGDFYGASGGNDRCLSYLYETSGVVGRYRGFQLGYGNDSNTDLEQVYTYTGGGLFDTLATKRSSNAVSRTFDYGYATNSTWVSSLVITGGHKFSVDRTPESNRDRLATLNTKWDGSAVTRFDYTHNAIGRRLTAKFSGSAYDADYFTGTTSPSYSGAFHVYDYNPRGELEGDLLYRGDTPTTSPSSGDELPRRFEYRYDNAGNRLTSGATGSAGSSSSLGDDEYETDLRNQYVRRENNAVRLFGSTADGATVAPGGTGSTASAFDRFWSAQVKPGNATFADNLNSGIKGTATIYAAIASGGTTKFKTQTRDYLVPMRNQYFTYDADGNLLTDSLWNYAYDAENRLISMEHRHGGNNSGGFGVAVATGMLANGEARRLEFTYDYLGRRVQKIVKSFNGTDYDTVIGNRKFLYDDWNLIAEFDALSTLTLVRSYTWGLDINSSLDATGGAGALLQVHDHTATKTFLPTYDGNGNVVSLIDAENSTLTIAAFYEYGPFGEVVRAEVSDSTVADFPFRFATKFTDPETGLVNFGHRYYSVTLGRFITRDPIEEQGGLNLFGYCENDSINQVDHLGMGVLDWLMGFFGNSSAPSYDSNSSITWLTPYAVFGDRVNGSTFDFGFSFGGSSSGFGAMFDLASVAYTGIPKEWTARYGASPAISRERESEGNARRNECKKIAAEYRTGQNNYQNSLNNYLTAKTAEAAFLQGEITGKWDGYDVAKAVSEVGGAVVDSIAASNKGSLKSVKEIVNRANNSFLATDVGRAYSSDGFYQAMNVVAGRAREEMMRAGLRIIGRTIAADMTKVGAGIGIMVTSYDLASASFEMAELRNNRLANFGGRQSAAQAAMENATKSMLRESYLWRQNSCDDFGTLSEL